MGRREQLVGEVGDDGEFIFVFTFPSHQSRHPRQWPSVLLGQMMGMEGTVTKPVKILLIGLTIGGGRGGRIERGDN